MVRSQRWLIGYTFHHKKSYVLPTLGQPYQPNGWVAHVGPTWGERWHANCDVRPTMYQRLLADWDINKGNGNKVSSVGIIVFHVLNYNDKKLKEKKIAEFCCRTSCRSFLLLTESKFISRFIYRNVILLCKLLIILCSFYVKTAGEIRACA
jgi:hypothetical protein